MKFIPPKYSSPPAVEGTLGSLSPTTMVWLSARTNVTLKYAEGAYRVGVEPSVILTRGLRMEGTPAMSVWALYALQSLRVGGWPVQNFNGVVVIFK